jgi:hypothetical protein
LGPGAGPAAEHVHYQVSWPSGLSLGEGQIRAARDAGAWKLELQLEASIPAFKVVDIYRSTTDENLCSQEFEKEFEHGPRTGKEKTVFAGGKAKRQTLGGGGASEFSVPECPRDALAYLFFLRGEVARGRLPGPQTVYFGGPYEVRAQFVKAGPVKVAEESVEADQLKLIVKGPASTNEFDLWLARDEARTVALIRVPFVLGTFSLERIR